MEISKNGLDLIKTFEGCKLKAYLCPAKVWTIGYGATYYEDGSKVKAGDVITEERAVGLLKKLVANFYHEIKGINQNQFDAITSFCYNLGNGNFNASTLKKKIVANPNDPSIEAEFLKWNKAGGKVLKGLTIRRSVEWKLYSKK
ncbi:Endolysin/autolysin [uncultured Caudovirales phage]|uniref:Endolysin n=1 Tax=uncultured Caudovirales phage TaxID=2100421 RepID=A0A6J5KZL0_9CAUD|nr:Endolysin/autolysin [uncultured Caudovirales phage]